MEESDDFEKAMQDAEDMLKDAHHGLKELGIDELVESDEAGEFDSQALADTIGISTGEDAEGGNNMVSEFEDMLKDADKELAELMDN